MASTQDQVNSYSFLGVCPGEEATRLDEDTFFLGVFDIASVCKLGLVSNLRVHRLKEHLAE